MFFVLKPQDSHTIQLDMCRTQQIFSAPECRGNFVLCYKMHHAGLKKSETGKHY